MKIDEIIKNAKVRVFVRLELTEKEAEDLLQYLYKQGVPQDALAQAYSELRRKL